MALCSWLLLMMTGYRTALAAMKSKVAPYIGEKGGEDDKPLQGAGGESKEIPAILSFPAPRRGRGFNHMWGDIHLRSYA